MNVLITTSTFPLSSDDGVPRFVYDLAVALARRCRVTVLAPHHPEAAHRERLGPLTVKRFQYHWPAGGQQLAYGYGMRENLNQSWAAKLQAPGYMASLCLAVRKLVRRQRFDVINSHWVVPQGLAVALALRRTTNAAHVVTAHAGDVFLLEKIFIGRHVARFVANHADMFLPVSSHVAACLNKLAGGLPRQAVQPMGIDWERFACTPGRNPSQRPFKGHFLLFVGRLVEKKGVAYLLDALQLLLQEGLDIGLVAIGSGVSAGPLKEKAALLGIQNRVRFLGSLGHGAILDYMQSCSALVIPSIVDRFQETEGMPTVLAEALAAGCKVVATRVGGIPDILKEGRNGWLAQPANARDLAQKLKLALGRPGGDIRRNARDSVRNLDWNCIARRYHNYFRAAIDHRHCRKGRV